MRLYQVTESQYLFISRRSSHYKYYRKLVNYLGDISELKTIKKMTFPRLKHWQAVSKLDINDLVDVHMRRKHVRYAWLKNNKALNAAVRGFYVLREKCRASYYFALFEAHPCHTVVLWNGMKQPNRTPYVVAKAAGKQTMLFENGLLPNTTVLDPIGVNALSSLPRQGEFYRSQDIENPELENILTVRAPHKNKKMEETKVELPERFVFVPFQVPNDTQIVCHSPWIDSMEALFNEVEQSINKLASEPNWQPFKIVIKEHPSWPKSFTELYAKNPNIVFANNHNTQELIEKSLAVVTINSTVGIESLLFYKPVITLGNCFYNVSELVTHANNQQELFHALANIEQQNVDKDLVIKFLSHLKHDYLLPQSWNNLTQPDEHFAAVKSRLLNPYSVTA